MRKFETKEELIDWIEIMHFQNTNGRETQEEMFRLGIEAAIEELTKFNLFSIQDVGRSLFRFAWGNERIKTYFITKTDKEFLPKGSRLLFKMICEPTNKPISTTETYPKKGDIINDVDGNKLSVVSVEWC